MGSSVGSGANDARGGGRYLSLGREDRRRMLERIGVSSVDDLFDVIPSSVRCAGDLDLDPPLAELELVAEIERLARESAPERGTLSFLGAGCHPHYIPTHVDALVQRQEFMTAYTPYQPEVGQGTLQSIFEFQSLVCMLTGMDVCNASMYDGGSAVAEAVLMARRLRRHGGRVLWSEGLHPAYREVARTYATYLDLEFETLPVGADGRTVVAETTDDDVAVVLQQPNFFGVVEDLAAAGSALAEAAAKFVVVCAEPVALGLARPPGAAGADIVVGELQSFGNGMSFGGPMVGFMTSREADKRNLPGRLVGETVDEDGKTGYVLTLSTREQHIRRARATSNICTNEALCALASCIQMCSLGRGGLRELAEINLAKATYARERIATVAGLQPVFDAPHFNELCVRTPDNAAEVVERCAPYGVIPGVALGGFDTEWDDRLLVCVTEIHSREDIERLAEALAGACR